MEFTPTEIDALIDAVAHRSKILHKRMEESMNSSVSSNHRDKLKTLSALLKKFIPLQAKKEPRVEVAKPVDTPAPLDLSKRRMLVVDDDRVIREMIKMMLSDHGCEIIDECGDGLEAIAKIKEQDIPYDMIFCDLHMPIMSGLDLLKLLRQSDEHLKLPFIMVTASKDKKFLKEAIRAGVSDFLIKPIEETKLISKIGSLLK